MLRLLRKDPHVQSALRFLLNFPSFRQMARRDQHWWEILFWLLLPLVINGTLIYWRTTLVELYQQKNTGLQTNINYVGFISTLPALTFCDQPVFDEEKLAEFLEHLEKRSRRPHRVERTDMLRFLQRLIHEPVAMSEALPLKDYNIAPSDYLKLIYNLTERSYISDQDGKYGIPIITDLGICYTFNSQLSHAVGLTSTIHKSSEWGNVSTYDFYSNFPIKLTYKHNFTSRINVYIHSPYEIPISSTRPSAVIEPRHNFHIFFGIIEVTYKSDLLMAPIENRNCRTHEESNLIMFPNIYSQNLCRMDCRAAQVIEICGCLPHFYASSDSGHIYKNHDVCSAVGLNCLAALGSWNTKDDHYSCQCLPNCAQMDITIFAPPNNSISHKNAESDIRILFLYPPRKQFRRRIYYTFSDYLVSYGSLLSLLHGGSVLNAVELIYFFTIRLFWYRRGYPGLDARQH